MAENKTDDILNELESQWTEEFKNAGTDKMPEGRGIAKITNTFVDRASSSGRKQLVCQLELMELEGDNKYAGRKLMKYFGLETVEDIQRLNSSLTNLGMDIVRSPREDLQRVLRELNSGIVANVQIKDNKDPQFPPNVYFNAGARRTDLEGAGGGASKSDTL